MDSISPISYVLPVGSSTTGSGSQGRQSTARQGQVFKAIVLEAKGPDSFILDIGGNRISAQAKIPLSIGQSLQLQVIATSPHVELRVLSDSANLFAGKTISLLGNSLDLSSLFSALKGSTLSQFSGLSTSSQQTIEAFLNFNQNTLTQKDGGSLLRQFISRLGLSLESLLARGDNRQAQQSLKAALLELSNMFKGAEELTDKTDRLLQTIELYQLAQLQLDKENIMIFPLPLPFLLKGYLLVEGYERSRDKREEEGQRFSLHLGLEGLGNLSVEFLKYSDGVYIRFISDSQIKLDFIEQYIKELNLDDAGIQILGITFSKQNVDPATDLLKRLIPEGESIVNTKI